MKNIVFAISLLFPTSTFACDAMNLYMEKWGLVEHNVIFETVDHTQRIPVYVFDMEGRTEPDKRYAVVWFDEKSCTVEAEYRDVSGMLYVMESSVFERIE